MRFRDAPTAEVSVLLADCSPERAWELVTDVELPTRVTGELTGVEWLTDVAEVAVGARFRGHNASESLGEWSAECEIVEVEPGRRWVWTAGLPQTGPWTTWAFEVDPGPKGTTVRQWARLGPGRSRLNEFIDAKPEAEGFIIARRLDAWRTGMQANLDWIAAHHAD